MRDRIRSSCVVCAWREGCKKKYSVVDPSRCPEFTMDVSIKDAPGRRGPKIIVEGRPGSGKSTLIERLLVKLGDAKVGGFYTREIREKGERVGFRIVTVDKHEGVLARKGGAGRIRVGGYTVNLEDVELVAVIALERAIREDDVVVIDEIGKMELYSKNFREAVDMALDSDKTVVATVPADGPAYVEEVKRRHEVRVVRLDLKNREQVLDEVAGLVKGALG